ncbi:MAG TPA: AAA family ATPase, partial [Chloroflexia bacterium]|nr:AAA family ATPase [Chloroflexia bacterium]
MSLPRLAPPFGPRLFTAKTRVPLPPPHFLSRPRLLESLRARISVHKLVVVLAPSGFGKTTMVAELARTLAGEAAWLTLDSSDQDLSVFVHYLIAAVAHGRPGFGADLLAWLAATPTPGDQIEDCAAILVDALEQLEATPLVLFLDDFQEVSGNASITRLLDRVLRYLPPPIHLVLSARREPALTTTRLLAEQQISGLGADDLRFTVSETEHWLALRADPAT